MGQFDIQALKAIEEGKPLPQGEDYQRGETFGYDTLREAVFQRDGYKCRICKAENTPLKEHHIGYWRGDHSNRMKNLAAICEKCHTSKNHSKDGLLWGLPYAEGFKEAAFMNSVKWQIYEEVKALVETHITYGSVTKRERLALGLEKSHANDAYCDWAYGGLGCRGEACASQNRGLYPCLPEMREDDTLPDQRIGTAKFRCGISQRMREYS